jgi:magnesium chelatase subunit I
MENVISNAERRAIRNKERFVVPRISDVYAALPAITGKLELEYEGEMKGADYVGRELIRAAIARTYDEYFTGANVQQIVQWFDLGGEIQLSDSVPAAEALEKLKSIQGLADKLGAVGASQKDPAEQQVSAAEFILEGLHAHKRIGRNEERVFKAGEKKPEAVREKSFEAEDRPYRQRRQFN